jgi:hypothetical protein
MPKIISRGLVQAALLTVAACWSGPAVSQDATRGKFSGEYYIYSGRPGDSGLPTKKDAKVGMMVTGPLAARMFQYMGSGATQRDTCVDGEETRVRDEVMCSRNKRTGKAECYFGFDLRSGKSTLGTTC